MRQRREAEVAPRLASASAHCAALDQTGSLFGHSSGQKWLGHHRGSATKQKQDVDVLLATLGADALTDDMIASQVDVENGI